MDPSTGDATGNNPEVTRPRRSSRAVAKPDFRAMENYGDLTSEYGDDLFQARDTSPPLDRLDHHDRQERAGGSRQTMHTRRPSGGAGGSGGRGMKKVGGGNSTKARRPPVVEELEAAAKKLEQDVAALQNRRREVRTQLEGILKENETLRAELSGGMRGKKEDPHGRDDGGLLYF